MRGRALAHDLTSFIGRRHELAEVRSILGSHRLVTITGPGGAGKTRLGRRVVHNAGRTIAETHYVSLASIEDPNLVGLAISQALKVDELSGMAVPDQLVRALSGPSVLVLLDNCEHLVAGVVEIVERLLSDCESLRILATSRQPLGLTGEAVIVIGPLSDAEAVELLIDRATLASPVFRQGRHRDEDLLALCHSVDNLPLGLELASRRLSSFEPAELARRILESSGVLGAPGEVRHRQQNLRTTVDWSYQLLSAEEQAAWRRLSVCAGGFAMELAQALLGEESASLVAALVDRSIVNYNPAEATPYRMLESIRQFGDGLLLGEERERAEAVLLAEMLALGVAAGSGLAGRGDDAKWLTRMDEQYGNLRRALSIACSSSVEAALHLSSAMAEYWDIRGRLHEARHWLDTALAGAPEPTQARAQALDVAGWIAFRQGEYERARGLEDEALALATALADSAVQARALSNLGLLAMLAGEFRRAAGLFESSLELARSVPAPDVELGPLFMRGLLEYFQGDLDGGYRDVQASLELAREHANLKTLAMIAGGLGSLALDTDRIEEARTYLEEAARICTEIDDRVTLVFILGAWARLSAATAEFDKALTFATAADRLREQVGASPVELWQSKVEEAVAAARRQLGPRAARNAAPDSPERALDAALRLLRPRFSGAGSRGRAADLPTGGSKASPSGALSRRETEVALLVAEGLGNQAIAARLFISPRTVETHLEHILAKLAVPNRAALAAWVGQNQAPRDS